MEEYEKKNICNVEYVKNISLEKNKMFYENKRKLSTSLKNHRHLNRVIS